MKQKITFIINPISGKGKGKEIEPIIKAYFKKKEIDVKIIFADYAGHAIEIVKNEIVNKPDVIVACGGDGTINEIAQELIGGNIPLGVIPIGSGNGLASNLNIPKNIKLALDTILENKQRIIDIGVANDRYFFSNIGLGIDANVIHRYTEKKQRNFIGYAKAGFWSLINYKPISMRLKIDKETFDADEYFFVFCSESNEAGYGISFTPQAKLDDGKIDLLCVKKLNFYEQISFFFAVLFRKLEGFDKAFLKQAKKVVFELDNSSEFKVQIDGEAVFFNSPKIEISTIPQALKVIIPKK